MFNSQIIAILAAILFPVFARAREKARQASCQSNCKQIGLAVLMYAQDYDERLASARGPDSGNRKNIVYSVWPYVKNEQIFICPSDGSPSGWYSPGPEDYHLSYGYNCYAMGTYTGHKLATFDHPAETIALTDNVTGCIKANDGCGCGGTSNGECSIPRSNNHLEDASWHNEGVNCLMVDGHVKWRKVTDIRMPNERIWER